MLNERELRKIVSETRSFYKKNGKQAVVKKYARYFREGYDAYGVPDAALRAHRRRIIDEYGDRLDLAGALALGDLLLADGKYEEGFLAIALAARRAPEFRPATLRRFARWLDAGVHNWAHADTFAGRLLEPFLVKGVVPLEAFAPWRRARSKWRRRVVPVAMLALLKEEADVKPLLAFVEPMMDDAERVVHQGLGWFLREAWKKRPGPVEAFLYEFKETAPRLIYQYATEKMTPAARARFRRSKKK